MQEEAEEEVVVGSEVFRATCRPLDNEQRISTAFHPQTDEQTERVNHFREGILHAYISPSQLDWDLHLPVGEFAINNAYHGPVQNNPFFLIWLSSSDTC